MTAEAIKALETANDKLGDWMSAALDDPTVCQSMKDDINAWFAAIEALKPMADVEEKGGCKMAWKQGFCYGDPEYYPPAASPAPVDDGERVRAAKIEAFDEALSIAEGSYSYGEQQNEIIAGIRAALAAIKERK